MELVCVEIQRNNVKLVPIETHFDDALDVVLANHAKVSPQNFAFLI